VCQLKKTYFESAEGREGEENTEKLEC